MPSKSKKGGRCSKSIHYRGGYAFWFVEQVCNDAGYPLPVSNSKEFDSLRLFDPPAYRAINRLCWLRETGQSVARVEMLAGTCVETVDAALEEHGFVRPIEAPLQDS